MIKQPYRRLLELTTKCFVKHGVPFEDASIISDSLVTADQYGVHSHGLEVLPAHIQKITKGDYNLKPHIRIEKETPNSALVNGDNSIGPLSALFCANLVIEKCSDRAIFIVNSFNNNTFGAAFFYSLIMAKKGLIGITLSNSPAQMPIHGGKDKLLGTNPFSIVIPNGKTPLIIDMATSVVAKSKFEQYRKLGFQLENGWALDADGHPTTDPVKGIDGLVLPMAGFKGYGLSLAIDIIAGLLSKASYLNEVGRFYSKDNKPMDVGYAMIGINPSLIFGEGFEQEVEEYTKKLRASSLAPGYDKVSLPGDDRLECFHRSTGEGISISENIYLELLKSETNG